MSDSDDRDNDYDKYYNANQDFDNYVHPPGSGNYGGDVNSSDLNEQLNGWKTMNAEADKIGKKSNSGNSQQWYKKK